MLHIPNPDPTLKMKIQRLTPLPIATLLTALACFSAAAADWNQQVDALMPKLADPNVPARYEFQMQLQDLASSTSRPGAEADRAALAAILANRVVRPEVPQPAKVWIVRQLEYMGRGEAVSALTKLLSGSDPELRECARRALEKNDAPAAAASLREALQKASGVTWQIGLINALGEQQDDTAVGLITPFLSNPDLSRNAAMALAKIASPDAVEALIQHFKEHPPAAGDALILAANRLMSRNSMAEAQAILSMVYGTTQSVQIRAAALAGLIQVDPARARALLSNALKEGSPDLRQVAIQGAATHPDSLMTVVVQALPDLSVPAQLQALDVVDASAEKAVLALASTAEEPVRLAALAALGRLGGIQSVPVLLRAATPSGSDGNVARSALTRLAGPGVNDAMVQASGEGDPKPRAAAITALADRNLGEPQVLQKLIAYAAESNPDVSAAALAAVGAIGSAAEIKPLVKMVSQTADPKAGAALKSIVARIEDKAVARADLVAAGRAAQGDAMLMLLDVLPLVGGPSALSLVTDQLGSTDESLKTAAVRALSLWPDYTVTGLLLKIASDPGNASTRKILALRGVARLIKESSDVDGAQRVQLAAQAMALATRTEEKKLLISALGAVGHLAAIPQIQPLLSDPNLRTEAAQAGLQLAVALRQSNPDQAKALAQKISEANISRDINRAARRITGR